MSAILNLLLGMKNESPIASHGRGWIDPSALKLNLELKIAKEVLQEVSDLKSEYVDEMVRARFDEHRGI
jgi:hypothetical protein